MNVLALIQERYNTVFGKNGYDELLKKAAQSKEKMVAVILTENELTKYHGPNKEYVKSFRESNNLIGMFDLGVFLPNTSVNFILYIFTKGTVDSFTVGEFHGTVKKGRIRTDQEIDWNKIYTDEYYAYLRKIEDWMDSSVVENDEYARFNTLNNELFEGVFSPKRYSENVYRIKLALKNEKTIALSEVADVIRPRPDMNRANKAMCLPVIEWRYPIDYSKLREGALTDTPIQKNDILFRDFNHIYLVDEEPQQEMHINSICYIIRPKSILSQYLLMYLQSETARIIMHSLSMGSVLSSISIPDMLNIPVVMPKQSEKEYLQTFRLKYYMPKDIADYNRFTAYIQSLQENETVTGKDDGKSDSVANILEEEWVQNIRVCKTEVMQEFLKSDIDELNTCFKGKAYKATLILAGSILEAVLIDWLSEIKGTNYFDEPYVIRKEQWDKRNNCVKRDRFGNIMYYEKEAGLAEFIDEIKELARPKWMKSNEAHAIRKKRNLVHAKLCLKDSAEINEQTCRDVIKYLKDVIETRGIHKT